MPLLGETALSGQPVGTLVNHTSYRQLALQGTKWLADLAGQAKPTPRHFWWNRLVEQKLVQFERSFGPIVDPQLLQATRRVLETLPPLPLVCEQRDFSPWNVHIDQTGKLVVFDWESAELQGLPAMDLLYYLSYLSFYLDKAMWTGKYLESYRASLQPETPTGRVRAECLALYASRLGLTLESLQPLRLLVWILHSHSEYRHFVKDSFGKPSPAMLQRSLFVRLWQEEARHLALYPQTNSETPVYTK
jgi:hypothetical protein